MGEKKNYNGYKAGIECYNLLELFECIEVLENYTTWITCNRLLSFYI